jgi:K+-transporting ATPase KdpF subunit
MGTILLIKDLAARETISGNGYLIGAIIAACILGYLIYTLIKPEKF